MQPPEEFLKTSVAQDGFHRIERVPKLVMAPGLVDEILAGMAREHDFGSAFATRHQVMSPCRDLSFTEDARLGHKIFVGSIANQCRIENGGRSGNRTHDRSNLQPRSRRCPRLCRTSSRWWRERDSHSRWWPSARTFPGKLLVYPDSLLPLNWRAPGWSLPPTHTQRAQNGLLDEWIDGLMGTPARCVATITH